MYISILHQKASSLHDVNGMWRDEEGGEDGQVDRQAAERHMGLSNAPDLASGEEDEEGGKDGQVHPQECPRLITTFS